MEEQIIFVNPDGTPTGETGPKLASHNADTKMHLAFSSYIFRRSDSKFLLTQRALTKKVWPGVWTNSVCGHPAPSETMEDAIRRRADFEIGIKDIQSIQCLLPNYTYRTPSYNGIIENEFCPVFLAYTDDEPILNPDEVENFEWISWPEYVAKLTDPANDAIMSYWAKDQYKQLKDLDVIKELL